MLHRHPIIRRILIRIAIITVVGIIILIGYFVHYERFAQSLIRDKHMYYEKANALKHVYAAAEMTSWLMQVASPEQAEKTVLWLGSGNEYMEQLVRFPKDTTAGAVKDLLNNQIGITVALWHAEHPNMGPLRDVVLAIGEQFVVIEKESDVRVNSADALLKYWPAVDAAHRYFEKRKYDLAIKTKHALRNISARPAN